MPHKSAMPYSVDMPLPPCVWIAWSRVANAASAAAYLAIFAVSPARGESPTWSQYHAALSAITRASSSSILALASGWAIPWCRAMGVPQTSRVRA